MIIQKENYVLDVDLEASKTYSKTHSLCDYSEDRNFYAQAKDTFPALASFLADFGILIERPDEISSAAVDNEINYHFISYTVVGKVLEFNKYEIDLFDGGLFLNIVIDNLSVPNEQRTSDYFTITVYNVRLPWVLNEPFPGSEQVGSVRGKIKNLFKRK
jgi:hypothetical protein